MELYSLLEPQDLNLPREEGEKMSSLTSEKVLSAVMVANNQAGNVDANGNAGVHPLNSAATKVQLDGTKGQIR